MAIYKDVSSLEVVGYTPPENGTFADGVQFILEKLDVIPEADVEPVRHGYWQKVIARNVQTKNGKEDVLVCFKCSECGRNEVYEEPYCNCGAIMDRKEEENEN